MIEQINIALEPKKGPKFLSLGLQPTVGTNVRKREHIHQLKVMKNEHHVLPSEQDDIVNSLNYEGIAVIELQFYHFLTVTDCVLALSQTK